MLNSHIFAVVIDQVIGQLNLYRNCDTIRLACLLRLVCQHANIRIRRIVLRYLDIVSGRQFTKLMMHGVPNTAYLRLTTIRALPAPSILRAFFLTLTQNARSVETLIFDDHATPADRTIDGCLPNSLVIPTSLRELNIVTSFGPRGHGYEALLQNNAERHRLIQRMALLGLPLAETDYLGSRLVQLAVGINPEDDNAMTSHVLSCARGLTTLRRLRLVFARSFDSQGRRISPIQRSSFNSDLSGFLKIEDVRPNVEMKMAEFGAWFAARVQDGTIWTIEGRTV